MNTSFIRLLACLLLTVSPVLMGSPTPPLPEISGFTTHAVQPGWGKMNNAPLPEDQAFLVEAIAWAPDRLMIRMTPANGYYIYRDRSGFRLLSPSSATASSPVWPEGRTIDDPHFGPSMVYFETMDVILPVEWSGKPGSEVSLEVSFQGCQEDGICYPPMKRTLVVPTGAAATTPAPVEPTTTAANSSTPGPLSGPWAIPAFFGLGLLLAFTPCVLPMVPILGGILSGAGAVSSRRAFALSSSYVGAHTVIFTLAGLAAGLAGQHIQAWSQRPAVVLVLVALFVVLGLAQMGWFHLGLPAPIRSRLEGLMPSQPGGSLGQAAILGALSALVVGPCVAPPLAAAVLYLAQEGNPWMGASALAALSLGMGVPLLLVGTLWSKWVPKAGPWMLGVQRGFGLLFLGLALWLGLRVWPAAISAVGLGLLVAWAGVEIWRHHPHLPRPVSHLALPAGLLVMVAGFAQATGALTGHGVWAAPRAVVETVSFQPVATTGELDAALEKARATGQPILLDFYADWCSACLTMEKTTFADNQVRNAWEPWLRLKVDMTDYNDEHKALLSRYGLIGPPATLFFTPQGDELQQLRLVGEESPEAFLGRLGTAVCQVPSRPIAGSDAGLTC